MPRKNKYKRKRRKIGQKEQKQRLRNDIKRANQRLRQLEHSGYTNSPAYRHILNRAFYNDANISFTKNGEIKFNTNLRNISPDQLDVLNSLVKGFLSKKTSTVGGVKSMMSNVFSGYNKKLESIGMDTVDDKDFLYVWDSAQAKALKEMYGSEQANVLINKLNFMDRKDVERFFEHYTEDSNINVPLVTIQKDVDFMRDMFKNPATDIEGTDIEWDTFIQGMRQTKK